MSPTLRPIHHAVLPLFLAFFFVFFFDVGALPLPPQLQPYHSLPMRPASIADFNPMVAVMFTLTVSAILLVIFLSSYLIDCTLPPIEHAARARRTPHGAVVSRGLDANVIAGFPTFAYAEVKEYRIGKGALECAVCLCEFEDCRTLRLIPKCYHVFHPECIDEWLSWHVTCPAGRPLPASGDPDKCETVDSGRDEQDHVEIDMHEPTTVSEDVMPVGNEDRRAEQPNRDPARESNSGNQPCWLWRSHSTGHLLDRPVADMDRFTLMLPDDDVRKQMKNYLPSESNSSRWHRSGDRRREWFGTRLDQLDQLDR